MYLDLHSKGEIMMVGEETDKMFQKNCKARVAYLNGSENIETPPVELIQFVDNEVKKGSVKFIYDIYFWNYVFILMTLIQFIKTH